MIYFTRRVEASGSWLDRYKYQVYDITDKTFDLAEHAKIAQGSTISAFTVGVPKDALMGQEYYLIHLEDASSGWITGHRLLLLSFQNEFVS